LAYRERLRDIPRPQTDQHCFHNAGSVMLKLMRSKVKPMRQIGTTIHQPCFRIRRRDRIAPNQRLH
jgi:hypothetical protein